MNVTRYYFCICFSTAFLISFRRIRTPAARIEERLALAAGEGVSVLEFVAVGRKLKHPSVLLSRVAETMQFARLCENVLMIDRICGNILKEVLYAFTDCGGCNIGRVGKDL